LCHSHSFSHPGYRNDPWVLLPAPGYSFFFETHREFPSPSSWSPCVIVDALIWRSSFSPVMMGFLFFFFLAPGEKGQFSPPLFLICDGRRRQCQINAWGLPPHGVSLLLSLSAIRVENGRIFPLLPLEFFFKRRKPAGAFGLSFFSLFPPFFLFFLFPTESRAGFLDLPFSPGFDPYGERPPCPRYRSAISLWRRPFLFPRLPPTNRVDLFSFSFRCGCFSRGSC